MITVMIIKLNTENRKVMTGKRKTRKKGPGVEVLINTVNGIGAGAKISTKDVMKGTKEMTETTAKNPAIMIHDLRNRKTEPSGLTALHGKES